MSRLSSDYVRLRLSADTVDGVLCRRWPRRKHLASAVHPLEPGDGIASGAAGEPVSALSIALPASVDNVLRDLDRIKPLRGARLHVELGDGWTVIDVATGNFANHGIRQLHAIALACMAELLGERSADHEARWFLQDDARHLLICATAHHTLRLLADAAQRYRLELASVRPHFSVHWNRYGRSLKDAAVFAVASCRYAMIAFAERGVISAISGGAWRGDVQELDARVDRVLSSIGWSRAAPATFMLVATEASVRSASRRWTVIESTQAE